MPSVSLRRVSPLPALLCVALLLVAPGRGLSAETLDNDAVIEMVRSGLPSSIIIKKIQASPNRFDVSKDGLVKLTGAKVPEDVIGAMMEAGDKTVSAHDETFKNLDEPGIYYVKGDVGSDMTMIEPSVIDKVKEGSAGSHMLGALTSAVKTKVRSVVTGPSANLAVTAQPVFLFYFGRADDRAEQPAQPASNQNDPMAMLKAIKNMQTADKVKFSSISSPNEVRLIKAEASKKDRSFVASGASGMTKESGIESSFVRPFKFERLQQGIYKVHMEQPLEPGEYMFVVAGVDLGQGQYVYDFSVK